MAGVTGRDVQQQRSNEDEAAPSGYPRLLIVSHHRKGDGDFLYACQSCYLFAESDGESKSQPS